MSRRPVASLLSWSLLTLLVACGGSDDADGPAATGGTAGATGGTAGKGGAAGAGAGGATAGAAGAASGAAGATAGTAGTAGAAGAAAGASGTSGTSGQSGTAGAAGAAAGSAGAAGSTAGAAGSVNAGGAAAGTAGAAAGTAGAAGASAGGASGAAGTGPTCADTCKGLCVGETCCDALRACGSVCCDEGRVCSFGACVVPGAVCESVDDCQGGEYCDSLLGDGAAGTSGAGGAGGGATCSGTVKTGKCLPKPPVCNDGDPPSDTCVAKCEYHPPPTKLEPELKYAWGGEITSPWSTDVMMTPIVVELDDDDCDGQITARDIPEIAFSSYANIAFGGTGTLHVISIIDGKVVEKWSKPNVWAVAQLAGGNIDAKPGNEVVACADDNTVVAFAGADGTQLWKSKTIGCATPAIADLDQDGKPEVIVEGGILDGETGAIKATFTGLEGTFAVSDIDGDGKLDIVTGSQVFKSDGSLFLSTGVTGYAYPTPRILTGGPAVADLDHDGIPEVIAVYFATHQMAVWHYDASKPQKFSFVRTGIDINGALNPAACPSGSHGNKNGGGPATVGDFNADGTPDVALAGGVGYAVLDGKKLMDTSVAPANTFLFVKQTQDCSSAGTGSSLFDFDGDGKVEVVYGDEKMLRIYNGATGEVLWETCNTTGTLSEYPVIADVDNDGEADIVAVSNAFGATNGQSYYCGGTMNAGVRVWSSKDGSWVRTRRTWNEHAYHVTNVNEDGSIPAVEPTNWKDPALNNFRQNKQPGQEFAAPDVIVSLLSPGCDGTPSLIATVRNVGEAVLPPGVPVGFYRDSVSPANKLGTAVTTGALYPAQAENVALSLTGPLADLLSQGPVIIGVADDGGVHGWHECRTDNNTSAATPLSCGKL